MNLYEMRHEYSYSLFVNQMNYFMCKKNQNERWNSLPKQSRNKIRSFESNSLTHQVFVDIFGEENILSLCESIHIIEPKIEQSEIENKAWEAIGKKWRNYIRNRVKDSGMGFYGLMEMVFGSNIASDIEHEDDEFNLLNYIDESIVGIKFYSLLFGSVKFEGIDKFTHSDTFKDILCERGNYNVDGTYSKDGKICVLWPSLELYQKYPLEPKKAWNEWKESRNQKWRANTGEDFWTIKNTGKVISYIENYGDEINHLYEIGNYFKTKEEAINMATKFINLLMTNKNV